MNVHEDLSLGARLQSQVPTGFPHEYPSLLTTTIFLPNILLDLDKSRTGMSAVTRA